MALENVNWFGGRANCVAENDIAINTTSMALESRPLNVSMALSANSESEAITSTGIESRIKDERVLESKPKSNSQIDVVNKALISFDMSLERKQTRRTVKMQFRVGKKVVKSSSHF